MKVICPDCGCHFDNEFKDSLKCSFWQRKGLGDVPKKYKKIIWDWLFALPYDEMANTTHTALIVSIYGHPHKGNDWSKMVEGYDTWTDEERRKFQKLYFLQAMGREVKLLPDDKKKK